jgi:hypothetical protein
MVSFEAEGFSYSLDVFYGCLGTTGRKLQFLKKKNINFFFSCKFFVIKTIDPDWIRIRIGVQPKMLDPDMGSKNPDPKHCTL